ncbi:caspase family protein [Pukyongiella litopenaei]|nr:caspase family protein [Pukyongiella litopenaei]
MNRFRGAAAAVALIGLTHIFPAGAGAEAPGTAAHPKIAIVIGNQDYENVADLGNARKDAEDIAALLREFRFNVFDGFDLEKREFEELLRTAVLNIPQNADVVFYYAGHGIQIGRRNYLLPVDAKFESIYDVPLETMTLDRVIDTLAARGAAHLAILDSCRDNPFENIRLAADLDANLFETRVGFDVFRTPINSIVAYSTSPGATAMDGEIGQNSPYTSAVLSIAREAPTENIQQLFPLIRERVHTATEGRQVPWESSTLVRPFHLAQLTPDATPDPASDATPDPASDATPDPVADAAPVAVSYAGRFDRAVSLDAAIAAELGQPIGAARLVEAPANGVVALNDPERDGMVTYAPEIADIRALDVTDRSMSDRFTIEVTPGSGPSRLVSVALELTLDACDLEAGDTLDLDGVGVFRLPNELDLRRGLPICEAALQRDPDVVRFRYQLGRLQQAARQFDAAYDNFRAAADAGHMRAKHALSVLLDTDRLDRDVTGIPHDPELALALLEEGVAQQDPYALHRLGKRLMREGETETERKRGFELLERAVELGHTFSMNELGVYFLTRDTDHYIPERGMRYLRASELREDIYGYNNLGFVALHGLDGNPTDYDRALGYFQAASEGGHPTAPANIARMILRGQVGGRDTVEALRWYDLALERGDGWGGANGAIIIGKGDVPGRGPADAAVRAAKAVGLTDEGAAKKARETLQSLPAEAVNRAMQMVLNEVGQTVAVDGQIGPATLGALEAASAEYGMQVPSAARSDPTARLLQAARVYWAMNPVRLDLF